MAKLNLRTPNSYDGQPGTQYKMGAVRLATDAESVAGVANNIAVTPAQLAAAVAAGGAASFASPPVLGFGSTTPRPVHGTTIDSTSTIIAGTSLTATLGNVTATNGNLVLGTAGNKINIATGANASVGTSAAMTAGAVTVANTSVTAASKIFCYPEVLGTVTAPQAYRISAIVAATSFTITSADATDTSTWNYFIIN